MTPEDEKDRPGMAEPRPDTSKEMAPPSPLQKGRMSPAMEAALDAVEKMGKKKLH